MTVLTTMALMVTALKAAVSREQQAHMKTRAALWPELDGSAEELAEAKARIAELEDAIATANAQARRDQELIDLWRERALATPARQVVDFRPQQQAAALQQAQAHLQQMAIQAQNAQCQNLAMQNALQQGQGMMMLGAQGLIDAELWCNCVPARHDMFLRGE